MNPARMKCPEQSQSATPFRPSRSRLALAIALALPVLASAQDPDNHCTETGEGQCSTAPGNFTLDWVPAKELPESLRNPQCELCGGRYIDPLANSNTGANKPEQSDINAQAGSSELQGDDIYLRGGVSVQQGYRIVEGEEAYYDRSKRSGTMSGGIIFREPGIVLQGQEASISSDPGTVEINDSEFVLHQQHMRGKAERLYRDENGIIYVQDGAITYCAPGDNDWELGADSMELDLSEGVGTARHAKLRVGGVPILYLPWMRMPLDDRRRTGLLWPDIGSDSRGGMDITTPLYLNLAPNYDALYSPRYIEDRGVLHQLELRYLNPVLGRWSVGGAYMGNDKRFEDDHPDLSNDRWLAQVKQNGLFEKRWRSQIDYSKASDVYYLKDLQTSTLETRRETSLLQLASMDYLGDRWFVGVDVQQYQSLANDISDDYKKLPQITGSYRPDNQPFQLSPILLGQYSYFDSDDERTKGQRLYTETGLTYPMLWQAGFFKPTVKYRYLQYELNDLDSAYTNDTPSSGAALVSLDGGLYFERLTHFGKRGLLQTLEPRLYYLYSDYQEQRDQPDFDSAELTFSYNQLFRETRFSGHDRIDDANQLSIGLTTRYISDEDGREYLNASLGQTLYFRDRKVRLLSNAPFLDESGSEMAAELNFYPNERLTLRSSLVWDPYSSDMNSGNVQASYRQPDGGVVNVGYSYRRPLTAVETQPVTEQAHFSAYYPLGNRWSLFGAINYSMEANRSVEDMFGLEYDTCCWRARLLHMRYYDNITGTYTDYNDPNLEREHSIQVQIVLKGMGGFGNRVTNLLEDMIRGFRDREY